MASTNKSINNMISGSCKLAFLLLLCSCSATGTKKPPEQKDRVPVQTGDKDTTNRHLHQSNIRPGESLLQGHIYTDTIVFREYDDNGDYYLLFGKKNGKEISLIYDWDQNAYTYNRGDIIKINWKIDSIRIAGDNDALAFAEKAVTAERIKEGNVSVFRKRYKKDIRYHYSSGDYTQQALDQIYRLVEYYIANSENELLEATVNSGQADLSYSIEQRKDKDKEYTVVGLAQRSEHHDSIIQWLYISFEEKTTLYEYNITTEQLTEFD